MDNKREPQRRLIHPLKDKSTSKPSKIVFGKRIGNMTRGAYFRKYGDLIRFFKNYQPNAKSNFLNSVHEKVLNGQCHKLTRAQLEKVKEIIWEIANPSPKQRKITSSLEVDSRRYALGDLKEGAANFKKMVQVPSADLLSKKFPTLYAVNRQLKKDELEAQD